MIISVITLINNGIFSSPTLFLRPTGLCIIESISNLVLIYNK